MRKNPTKSLFVLFLLMLMVSCRQERLFYNGSGKNWAKQPKPSTDSLLHTVYLIGDAGKPQLEPLEPTLQVLQDRIVQNPKKKTLVFLGDNLYPRGLPPKNHPDRKISEQYLDAQLSILDKFNGQAFFIPGNHDWAQSRDYGYSYLLNQEAYLNEKLPEGSAFLPLGGCPGPEEVLLSDKLVLILIDTQWWLHPYIKPGSESDCGAGTKQEFLAQLNHLVMRHHNKQVIVAGHHPIHTNGTHGGHAPNRLHLFPLTEFNKNLYVPLPVLGSVYTAYRTLIGNLQDNIHPDYKAMTKGLSQIFAQHPNLVYACGHDHNLQYFHKQGNHFVVSGAGCKQSSVANRKSAEYAQQTKGFAQIDFYADGQAWVSFTKADNQIPEGQETFKRKLFDYQPKQLEPPLNKFEGKSTEAAAVSNLDASELKRIFLGDNYRSEWLQPIANVPYFDFKTEKGGLEIIKRGGGMQTRSLRFRATDGKEYNLRSIQKFPEKAVPPALRGTIAQDIVEDQISGSHPYGAFAVPRLASALGIYHTNPQLFYAHKDPRLGEFATDFEPGLYLFEERPDEDWRNADFFGNTKDIKSTFKTIEKIQGDNDDLVRQDKVVLARLFDMWLGDWDRHDDQWRFAVFKDKENDIKYYEPIPRDRDQVFFNAEGFFMDLGTRKWGLRKLQGFKHQIRDPTGLAFNARYFDRTFLTEPDWSDWKKAVEHMQATLTDSLIEQAVADMPDEIINISGEAITEKLKSRRNALMPSARTFYLSLARTVDVVGSDKHEHFIVERLNDEQTRVRVFKIKKESRKQKHLMYERLFERSETKEIRLYGLGGHDLFEVDGKVNKAIKIRIIGGDEPDEIEDRSVVSGIGKKTLVYDTKETTILRRGTTTKDLRSDLLQVNQYDRKDFNFDVASPLAYFSFNPDDGVFVGGGIGLTLHGFRKKPYKSRHTLKANYAPLTSSYNIIYESDFRQLFGNWDLHLLANAKAPSFVDFFYGLGNESESLRSQQGNQFHRVRYEQLRFFPEIGRQSLNGNSSFRFGTDLRRISLNGFEDAPPAGSERFLTNYLTGEDSIAVFGNQINLLGLVANYQFQSIDDELLPSRGVKVALSGGYHKGLDSNSSQLTDFSRMAGDFTLYLSTGQRFKATWATRVGGAVNNGQYAFFQANTIGGLENLRGYRRMRFAGDQTLYWNNDLRIKLFNFRTMLFPGQFGISGLFDVGRVWYEDEAGIDPTSNNGISNLWHKGFGGGIWFTPFQATVINVEMARAASNKRWLPFLRMGFMF